MCFCFFLRYWRSTTGPEKAGIFNCFLKIWEENKWSVPELVEICHQLDERNELLNPNSFRFKQTFYLHHVKSWYQIEFFSL